VTIKSDSNRSKKDQSGVFVDTPSADAQSTVFGYLRVSTSKQDVENQKFEILKLADEMKVRVDEWVEETASGKTSSKDRKLGGLIDRMKPGDTLIVSEISRIGRSLTEVMSILHGLMEAKVGVYTCKENFRLDDSINSKVLAFAFSLASEIERQMLSSRTREALARRKAEGVKLGRPKGSLSGSKLDGREQEIRDILSKGVSKASAARLLGVSRGTLYAFIRSRLQQITLN
jgi:DNA invertase Pin-like site-specific DNA recombinase